MKQLPKLLTLVWVIVSFNLLFSPLVVLATTNQTNIDQINFDNFTGVYHLSRDKNGLSLLTSEEIILANFPSNNSFYGITRSIPKKYQNHSVEVKVLNITDSAGNSVPYKTKNDSDNLIITTGDPAITLYGSHTFKINYQTSGVINLSQKNDEFLLNVNGRGWDRPFNQVNATLFIPNSFNASLTSDPTCYTVLNDSKSADCEINTQKNSKDTVITSKVGPLIAHQALVLKLEFAPSTFTNKHTNAKTYYIIAITTVAFTSVAIFMYQLKKPD